MKKIIIILIALSSIAQCLFMYGCGSADTVETDEITSSQAVPEETTEIVEESTSLLVFDKEGIYYTIIRGAYAESVEVGAAVDLNAAFKEVSSDDWKPTIKDDFVIGQKKDDVFEIEGKEILVGITNRKETHDLYATLSKDQYVIKAVGEKIVIVGYDYYSTAAAVEYFIATFL